MSTPRSSVTAAVLLAALGYFVDIYDLVLFSVLRVSSLKSLGVDEASLVPTGGLLLDLQLGGMILGGVAWGVLADKRGRLTVLFGSIVIYSLGNLANAFVDSVWAYGACRLLAGFGLAGELGAGITLVSELLPKERRGIGTTIVASIGLSGALAAGLIGDALVTRLPLEGWRYAYALGGGVGLLLLVLRLSVFESGLFERTKAAHVPHGDVRQLLFPMERGLRFLRVIMVGMPIWFVAGVLFVFSPEIGLALGLPQKPTGGQTIFWAYTGVTIGDLLSGFVSHAVKSRKRVIGVFLSSVALSVITLLTIGGRSMTTYYALMAVLGFTTGYWVLFVTTAAEQFGTNLRATVTTSAPNFVRGTAIPITAVWMSLKPSMGTIPATMTVGLVCIALGLLALWGMPESYSADLDFVER
ncbi:MAG: MFS transporter [Archangiaceae bacterium]|nr:MFS transporter [Archangiaceae bacterium]